MSEKRSPQIARRTAGAKGCYFLAGFLQVSDMLAKNCREEGTIYKRLTQSNLTKMQYLRKGNLFNKSINIKNSKLSDVNNKNYSKTRPREVRNPKTILLHYFVCLGRKNSTEHVLKKFSSIFILFKYVRSPLG